MKWCRKAGGAEAVSAAGLKVVAIPRAIRMVVRAVMGGVPGSASLRCAIGVGVRVLQ
jgi:hypothetical protein